MEWVLLRFAAPTESLPGTHGSGPSGGRSHSCATSVQETADTIPPTALRSTTLAASSVSRMKLSKQPAPCVSPSFEAVPIYATSSISLSRTDSGSASAFLFEACSTFTEITTYMFTKLLRRFTPKATTASLPLLLLRLLPGGTNQFPGRTNSC
jgi:hypothetical protein